jgi:hypothetical protein
MFHMNFKVMSCFVKRNILRTYYEIRQQFQNPRLFCLTFLGFSQWRHEFDSWILCMKFMMDKLELG